LRDSNRYWATPLRLKQGATPSQAGILTTHTAGRSVDVTADGRDEAAVRASLAQERAGLRMRDGDAFRIIEVETLAASDHMLTRDGWSRLAA
jgi:hypothetical protein